MKKYQISTAEWNDYESGTLVEYMTNHKDELGLFSESEANKLTKDLMKKFINETISDEKLNLDYLNLKELNELELNQSETTCDNTFRINKEDNFTIRMEWFHTEYEYEDGKKVETDGWNMVYRIFAEEVETNDICFVVIESYHNIWGSEKLLHKPFTDFKEAQKFVNKKKAQNIKAQIVITESNKIKNDPWFKTEMSELKSVKKPSALETSLEQKIF